MICMGAAIQNILLSAHGFGLGSSLTSGQAMGSERIKSLFNLSVGEEAVCFINIGTVSKPKTPRRRPLMDDFLSSL
jgi:nitroreductase